MNSVAIEWHCRYNCHSAHLPWGIVLRVDWEKDGYRITVNDVAIKYHAKTVEDGKKWALAAAEKMAKDILSCIAEKQS